MLVLFETPAGYAVFKLMDEGKLAKSDSLYEDFESIDKARNVVKLKQFQKFEDTTEALSAATAAVEGKMSKSLKKLLKKVIAEDAHEKLAVADAKLGGSIQEKLDLSCVYDSKIGELMRCIRSQISGLISEAMAKNKNVGKPRNYALESGVYRFGKGSMYHKKAIYKFTKKVNKKAAPKKAVVFVEKQVGGAKNGGTRMVRAKKLANDVPTVDAAAPGTSKNFFANHVRKVRASLTAGTVAIVLAGVHKGKRVVVLKQLGTGLLLVTGPHKLNGCPLRRVNQRYLVATSTKLDVSKVSVPENINDKYFARVKAEKSKKEGDIFEAKKEAYKPSEQRKADQAAVDAQVLAAIKGHADGAVLKQYLKASFSLSKGEFPHKMCF